MAEQLDEFQFKPLTEGLGFHKKAEKIRADILATNLTDERTARTVPEMPSRDILFANEFDNNSSISEMLSEPAPRNASQSISDLIASLPPSLDFVDPSATPKQDLSRPQIFQPLARQEYKAPSPAAATGPTIGNYLPTPGTKAAASLSGATNATIGGVIAGGSYSVPTVPNVPTTDVRNSTSFFGNVAKATAKATAKVTARATTTENLVPVSAGLAAGILDAMVVGGLSTIMLVSIIAITRIDLPGLLGSAPTDTSTMIHLALLFVAVLQMYMLIARSFFTATLGEWAFDMQLGTDAAQRRAIYPVLVAVRSVVMTATGLVLIPLASLIVGRDLGKYVSGLELFRRP